MNTAYGLNQPAQVFSFSPPGVLTKFGDVSGSLAQQKLRVSRSAWIQCSSEGE